MTDKQQNDREFAATIRHEVADDEELRGLLKKFGWHPELPAIQDEHGNVLIGNRRLKIANEEGIAPVIKTIAFGVGRRADAERLKLALISNMGGAPFSSKDRKRICKYLRIERHWTVDRIAEALNVSVGTVSGDLKTFSMAENVKGKGTDTLGRKKSTGRPQGSKKPASPQSDKVKEVVTNLVREGKPVPRKALAEEFAVSEATVQRVHNRVEGQIEAEPHITPEDLSMTAQEKLAAAIRQAKRKLDDEFRYRVEEEIKSALSDGGMFDLWKKKHEHAEKVIKARAGVFTHKEYRMILSWLHPDRHPDPEIKEHIRRAFELFKKEEEILCSEKELPTGYPPIPRTYAEMMQRREEVRAARRRAREQRNEVGPHKL